MKTANYDQSGREVLVEAVDARFLCAHGVLGVTVDTGRKLEMAVLSRVLAFCQRTGVERESVELMKSRFTVAQWLRR